MRKTEKTYLLVSGGLVTILIAYINYQISILPSDFSLIPSWHTYILPDDISFSIKAIIILFISIVIYLISKLMIKIYKYMAQ